MTDYDPTPTPEDELNSDLSNLSFETFDTDGDGYAETLLVDTDGDGLTDTVIMEDVLTGGTAVGVDTDGDGVLDTFAFDDDGDGLIDAAYTEGGEGQGDVITDDPGDTDGPGTDLYDVADDAAPFDAGSDPGDDEGLHGEPQADVVYHQAQPGPVDCLPTSVAMSLTELTGAEVPADDVIAMANAEGFMTDSGMAAEDALTLFESYGVDAELSSGTVDGLRTALDNGDTIVVGIDSSDLYADGGGPFDPGMQTGHAVVVTGIDDGPPGVVYINDPGFPDGAGVEIPLELFEDSWEDSDNTMVVATPTSAATAADDGSPVDVEAVPVGTSEAEVPAPTDADGQATAETAVETARRLILLPLTFKIGS